MDTQINDRIAQWEQMTREAPDDMAWFSLGNAYQDAHRLDDAQAAFEQAIQLNPNLSRAYQLRGQALIQLNRTQDAADVLIQGYTIAAKRGDLMPKKNMGSLLEKIGQPVPEVDATPPPATAEPSGNTILDRRTGQPGTRMPEPPMRGPLGRFIADHYSQETWRLWIAQGTKVINELRLDFSNETHQQAYEQQMKEWLEISDQEVEAYTREK